MFRSIGEFFGLTTPIASPSEQKDKAQVASNSWVVVPPRSVQHNNWYALLQEDLKKRRAQITVTPLAAITESDVNENISESKEESIQPHSPAVVRDNDSDSAWSPPASPREDSDLSEDDFLDVVESPDQLAFQSLDECADFFNQRGADFDNLKELHTFSKQTNTICFPALAQYNNTSPTPDFNKMTDQHYVENTIANIVDHFEKYIHYRSGRIKNLNKRIRQDEANAADIQIANEWSFECAEQMRRTSYALHRVLDAIPSFHDDDVNLFRITEQPLSTTATKIQLMKNELTDLHRNIQNHIASHSYDSDSDNKPTMDFVRLR